VIDLRWLEQKAEEKLTRYAAAYGFDRQSVRLALVINALPEPDQETIPLGLPLNIYSSAESISNLRKRG
jgi:hypothetical protein